MDPAKAGQIWAESGTCWQAHTRNCRACSGALRHIRRIRPMVLIGTVVAGLLFATIALPALGVGSATYLLVAAVVLRQLVHWERQFVQGSGQAPRNRLA